MGKIQSLIGFFIFLLVVLLGRTMLSSSVLFFRLLIGVGYALNRGFMGFAGSVNWANSHPVLDS